MKTSRGVEIQVSAALVVAILAERPCERSTTGECPPESHPLAVEGADLMCDPCLARLVGK
jgi:hypothetical protein